MPAATAARASTGAIVRSPPVLVPVAAGTLHGMRGVEDDAMPGVAHDGQRAHVDDEIVVAERRAALGDEIVLRARGTQLRGDVVDVLRREELAFLDVDHAAAFRCRDEQVVWRQRNAGICRMSMTFAAVFTCATSWISVSTGQPNFFLIAPRILSPCARPGPRNDLPLVRLALSNDALKTNGIPKSAVSPTSSFAIEAAEACDSSTHGPAMRKNDFFESAAIFFTERVNVPES